MKLNHASSAIAYDRTNKVRCHIHGHMTNVAERQLHQSSYSSEGYGTGFNWETRDAKWDQKMAPDGKSSYEVEDNSPVFSNTTRENRDAPSSKLDIECFRASDSLSAAATVGSMLGIAGLGYTLFH